VRICSGETYRSLPKRLEKKICVVTGKKQVEGKVSHFHISAKSRKTERRKTTRRMSKKEKKTQEAEVNMRVTPKGESENGGTTRQRGIRGKRGIPKPGRREALRREDPEPAMTSLNVHEMFFENENLPAKR